MACPRRFASSLRQGAATSPPRNGIRSSTSQGSDTLDDTAILNDFLAACVQAKEHPVRPGKPVGLRDRAMRLLHGALRRDLAQEA